MNFNNLSQMMEYFKDEITCLKYLEKQRWGDNVCCAKCGHDRVYKFEDGIRFKCAKCRLQFTAKVGTVFQGSKVSMRNWMIASYLLTTNKKGVSSYQLATHLGVTQKTAWFMLHRLRAKLGIDNDPNEQLDGTIECDETFVGGKNKNRHKAKKAVQQGGRSFVDKTPILGMLQRGGKVKTMVIPSTQREYIRPLVEQVAAYGCNLITDEWRAYKGLDALYNHNTVDHSCGQYAKGEIHTNGIEGFWAWIKRMVIGTYHNVSKKHLQQYAHEATFRYNTRNMSVVERLNFTMSLNNGALNYKKLTA